MKEEEEPRFMAVAVESFLFSSSSLPSSNTVALSQCLKAGKYLPNCIKRQSQLILTTLVYQSILLVLRGREKRDDQFPQCAPLPLTKRGENGFAIDIVKRGENGFATVERQRCSLSMGG